MKKLLKCLLFYQMKKNVFHIFPIFTEKRDELQSYLKDNSIGTIIHYPIPPHKQSAYKEWNNQSYPVTEKIHETELSLPMSPTLTNEQVNWVIKCLNEVKIYDFLLFLR